MSQCKGAETAKKLLPEDVLDYLKAACEEHPHDASYAGGRAAMAGIAFDQLELALRNQRAAASLDPRQMQTAKQYSYERRETILALRSICGDLGDLDWTDDLHLADILNKHLAPYLYERLRGSLDGPEAGTDRPAK